MTKRYLMNNNVDLLTRAARLLGRKPIYSLSVEPTKSKGHGLLITASSTVHPRERKKQIAHVDIFVNGRPYSTLTARNGAVRGATVPVEKTNPRFDWLVQAFDHDNRLVASSRRHR